jgi:polynucleotide 5'-hydroxyl-kinase GRC3/NOL9
MIDHVFQAGEFRLLSGPATLKVLSGAVEVVGARLAKGAELKVPLGKRVPVKPLGAASVRVDAGAEAFARLEGNSIPEAWDALAARIAKERRAGELYTIVVLGEVDTGKTFFSTYLANRLLGKLKRTAILDCDTGQSDIGPPGAFGMLLMKKAVVFLAEEPPTHLYVTGSHSPSLHFLPTVTALEAMRRKAVEEADALIVDTTGWVQGDGGRALKKAKLDLLDPCLVVLMQRGTELEHLVRHLPAKRVVRLPVSKKASPTSQMDRKSLREHVSVAYFKGARVFEVPFAGTFTDRAYFGTGTPVTVDGTLHAERLSAWEGTLVVTDGPLTPDLAARWPKDLGRITHVRAGRERGLLVGLLDAEQDCLAMARLEALDFGKKCYRLRSPYKGSAAKVKGVQFGSLKVAEDGREAGFLEPGSL